MNLVIGIDIAKAKFDAAYIDEQGVKHHAIFDNDAAGFRQLQRWVKRVHRFPYLIMEATGNYWQKLAHWAYGKKWQVSVINPQQSHAYSKSIGQRSKTDKLDAFLLARYGRKENPQKWQPITQAQARLDNLIRQQAHLTEQLNIERVRLQTMQSTLNDYIKRSISFIEQELKRVKQDIAEHIAKDRHLNQQLTLLTSIPGIGKSTAAQLMAFFGDIKRFKNAKHAASFAGLVPRHHQSGSSVHGQSRIGRGGHSRIRHALFMPAVAIGFGKHAKFASYVQKLEQNGMRRKAIVIALMHKLLRIAFAVLTCKQPYNHHYHHNQTPTEQ